MKKKGLCYQNAFHGLDKYPGSVLVHGIVTGQGPIEGVTYGHAWLEVEGIGEGTYCVDFNACLALPKEIYYRIGKQKYTVTYTASEAAKLARKAGHYGPWDKKIDKAVHRKVSPL